MAKRKNTKKENVNEEIVEFFKPEVEEVVEKIEQVEVIEDIEPIDMSEDLKEIEKEIFEEPKKEEPKIEEKPKNKMTHRFNQMVGYIWNGVEYDF